MPSGVRLVRFGVFEVDLNSRQLWRRGLRVPVQQKPFRVLELLLERGGGLVTREELHNTLWPGRIVVDFDHGINNAVARLREVLGDDADNPRFIETVPRAGYRFVCPVTMVDANRHEAAEVSYESTNQLSAPAPPSSRRPSKQWSWRPIPRWRVLIGGTSLCLALFVGVTALLDKDHPARKPDETAATRMASPSEPAAAEAYLKGRHLWEKRNKEALLRSIDFYREALLLDPAYADAYAGIAEAYAVLGGNATIPSEMPLLEARIRGLDAARKALQINPQSCEAHAAMALVLMRLEPRSEASDEQIEQHLAKALSLKPDYAAAHHWFGLYLSERDRKTEALAHYRIARRLNPTSPNIAGALALLLCSMNLCEEGIETMRGVVEIDPWQFNARIRMGWMYAATGRMASALTEFKVADQISPNSRAALTGLGYTLAALGNHDEADVVLARLRKHPDINQHPLDLAIVLSQLKRIDEAFTLLNAAVEKQDAPGDRGVLLTWDSPIFDMLKADPRFSALRKRAKALES